MSNLAPDVKRMFDNIAYTAKHNELQEFDNYAYHIELCMIPKSVIGTYETIYTTSGPLSSEMKSFINNNKFIIADTGGCPKFNIISAKLTTVAQTGSIKTTKDTDVSMSGRTIEAKLNIQEVFGFTLVNKIDFLAAMLGYQSRHMVPMFLNIWFSGHTNMDYKDRGPVESVINDKQFIYRGVITEVKTLSADTGTTYEVSFAMDNYSTDDKAFQTSMAAGKALRISKNTTNFLGDIALQLEQQVNENILNCNDIAVSKWIYTPENKPLSIRIYDIDKTIIYDGTTSKASRNNAEIAQLLAFKNLKRENASILKSEEADMKERKEKINEEIRKEKVTLDEKYMQYGYTMSPGLEKSIAESEEKINSLKTERELLASQIEKVSKDKATATKEKKATNSESKEKIEKLEQINDKLNEIEKYSMVTSTSADAVNSFITKNIQENKTIKQEDNKFIISCSGENLDNVFNSILVKYIDVVDEENDKNKLLGISASANFVPSFLAEYDGRCYYKYLMEVYLTRVPGLADMASETKKILKGKEEKFDFTNCQLSFLVDSFLTNNVKKSYKYMYSGSDISVLEYNTDISNLYFMDTGISLIKNAIENNNLISGVDSEGLTYAQAIVKRNNEIFNNKPAEIKYLQELREKITKNGTAYMEDMWNTMIKDKNKFDTVYKLLQRDYCNVAQYGNPVVDKNESSTSLLSVKKIAWNNIFRSSAALQATIKIIGDPYWLSPNIPISSMNNCIKEHQSYPVVLFSYVPFIEQQDDDTFKKNEYFCYDIPYYVLEVNSLFENGQFIQELNCTMPSQFIQDTYNLEQQNETSVVSNTNGEKTLKLKGDE